MYGYVKVGSAVPKLRVADCVYNKEEILKLVEAAAAKQVRVLSFPSFPLQAIPVRICSFKHRFCTPPSRQFRRLQKQQKH